MLPLDTENNVEAIKEGRSVCTSYLGLIATGDCSIEAAKKDGSIIQITFVDVLLYNFLGGIFFSRHTTIVRGE